MSKKAKGTLNARTRRHQARIFILQYLQTHHCVDCGHADPRALVFDHIDPSTKKEAVSTMMGKGAAIMTIHAEVQKCEVRCSNCHAHKTSDELSFYTSSEEYAEWVLLRSGKRYPKREVSASERGTSRRSARKKKCTRCFLTKSHDDFTPKGAGLHSWCRECRNEVRRAERALRAYPLSREI